MLGDMAEGLLTYYSRGRRGRTCLQAVAVSILLGKKKGLLQLCQGPFQLYGFIPCGLGFLGPEPGQDGGMGWHGLYGHASVGWKSGSALAG